jgi:nitroreductase
MSKGSGNEIDVSVFEVMRTTRAMRRLKPDPVPRELLEQIVELASFAPTGGNTQTYSYVVVDDRNQVARIAPLWRRCQSRYIASQRDAPPPTTTAEEWNRIMTATDYLAATFEAIPALIVACLEMRTVKRRMLAHLGPAARATIGLGVRDALSVARNFAHFTQLSTDASIYPGVGNLLLAARSLGLGASLATWHLLFEQEFKQIFNLPPEVNTYAVVPIGYPLGKFGPVNRRPIAESIHWNSW